MSAEMYLVRHGETEWNAQGRFQGRKDSPLNARGRAQGVALAQLLRPWFAERPAPVFHVSPLGRARATSDILAGILRPAEVRFEPALAEVALGSWDGLTHVDIDAMWPGLLHGSTAGDWYFRSPDGEALSSAKIRVAAWLAAASGTIVAVSHGLIGRLIRGMYLDLTDDEMLALPVPQDTVWRLADGRIQPIAA